MANGDAKICTTDLLIDRFDYMYSCMLSSIFHSIDIDVDIQYWTEHE